MKNNKIEQSGRSMIEMLAVLAIIGILSVAGIAGYSKAMGKIKQQNLSEQVSMVASEARTLFGSRGNYTGLSTANALTAGIIPKNMEGTAVGTAKHALGGVMDIVVNAADANAFDLSVDSLSRDVCVYLATADWGVGTSGLKAIAIGATSYSGASLPVSLSNAGTECSSCSAATDNCKVTITML